MKSYKRKYQAEFMASDIKPSKIKRQINKSVRQDNKKIVRKAEKNGTDDK